MFVGGVTGLFGQVLSDVVTSICNKQVTISSWQTYVGSMLGGAVGGGILAASGNVNAANAASGFVSTFVGQGLEKLTGKQTDRSWDEIFVGAALDGVMSYGIGKRLGLEIPKVGGSNWDYIYRGGLTKMRNGFANKMGIRVVGKGIVSQFGKGALTFIYYGLKVVK